MHALTIWQPWASLIIAGAKPYEFRGWAAPAYVVGRRIAIHAGKRKPVLAEIRALRIKLQGQNETGLDPAIALPLLERWTQDMASLPLAHVVGTAMLGKPVRACDVPEFAGAFTNDSERMEHSNWAWPLADVQPLMPPVPARGAQGFWTLHDSDIEAMPA